MEDLISDRDSYRILGQKYGLPSQKCYQSVVARGVFG